MIKLCLRKLLIVVKTAKMKVAKLIKEHGISRVARASGYPVSTIFRWYQQNKVPGTGKSRELRERELIAAFAALDAVKATNAKR